uniref:Shroom family member 1 n=1 Tax=Nannospalax galili TaxID=1026970 RepID=A0A8C6RYD7_NANGA
MEALGAGGDHASPASSTGSLDLRRLSTRADSAYSSFSAASGGPETRTPSPGTELLPYLDWDYVRVVWGGGSTTPHNDVLRITQRPRPALAVRSEPRPSEVQGSSAPLSRQATPLLYALAAEAEAAARTSEPPSPPASRAAYRQRLQGAQRRVLRETSFQRKELRMSLPARLRHPAVHLRSASLSHRIQDAEPVRISTATLGTTGPGRLATQQRMCCFSEPGKLHRLGWSGGSGVARPDTQELPRGVRTEFKGLQEAQARSAVELGCGFAKLGNACMPASPSHSTSGEAMGPCRGSERTVVTIQVGKEGRRPRLVGEGSTWETRVPEAAQLAVSTGPLRHMVSTGLPSLPDDDVFLEEALLDRMKSPQDSYAPQGLPTKMPQVSDGQFENGLSQKAGQATVSAECPFHECSGTTGADDYWQGANTSVGVSSPPSCGPPGTANGDNTTTDPTGLLTADPSAATKNDPLKPPSVCAPQSADYGTGTPGGPHYTSLTKGTSQTDSKPAWPSQHFEELVQELARLDPSLSDTLASQSSPELPLGLLDGLIPSIEVWAAVRPTCEEAGQDDAVGASEAGSHGCRLIQQLPTSGEVPRSENSTLDPMPDQPSGHGLQAPNHSIEAKKVELASILQKMLRDLHAEQERLQGTAAAWAGLKAALEAAVSQACASRELERFSRFITDLERVLGLLLLLGSRLARVHFALAKTSSDSDPEERASLLQRLRLLQRQQEDTKDLKEHVARRERALREVLEQALSKEHLHSYCMLLATKAKILSQQLSLDEQIRLLQDHLEIIQSDLSHQPLSSRLPWSSGICSLDKPRFPAPPI